MGGASKSKCTLQWDDANFTLRDPDGQSVLDIESSTAHRFLDDYQLYTWQRICIPVGTVVHTFEKDVDAVAELRELLEAGMRKDAQFRAEMRQEAMRYMKRGGTEAIIAVGMFALILVFLPWIDQMLGGAVQWFGGLIRAGFFVLFGVFIHGAARGCHGIAQWRRVRRIERSVQAATSSSE